MISKFSGCPVDEVICPFIHEEMMDPALKKAKLAEQDTKINTN